MGGPSLLSKIDEALAIPEPGHRRRGDAQEILEIAGHLLGNNGLSRYLEVARRFSPLARSHNSIDQLVTNADAPDLALVAKLCIGYFIGTAESAFKPRESTSTTWLFSFLREHLSRAKNVAAATTLLSETAFVVFNYDRLVEHVISSFLSDRFELSEASALEAMKAITIVHPYGWLGPFATSATDVGFPVGYRHFRTDFPHRAVGIVAGLRTFGESVDQTIPAQIKTIIDSCRNLIFVGFGFGEENLDLILPDDNRGDAKRLYATNFNINPRRWRNLESNVLSRLARTTDQQKSGLYASIYGPGRVQTATTCEQLVDHYSLEW